MYHAFYGGPTLKAQIAQGAAGVLGVTSARKLEMIGMTADLAVGVIGMAGASVGFRALAASCRPLSRAAALSTFGAELGFDAAGAVVGGAIGASVADDALAGALQGAGYGMLAMGLGRTAVAFGRLAIYGRACFRADTPMPWEHGHKKAEEFRVGDRFRARSESDPNGSLELKTIEEVFVRQAMILEVTVAGRVIGTTAEHPFYAYGKGWTAAGALVVGDLLATAEGQWVPVELLDYTGTLETVYNFRVADHHTYFVGDEDWGFSVWAHNVYEVGPYNQVRKNSLRNVKEANHAPQTAQAELLIGRFNKDKGISISLPKEQHDIISFWQANRRELFGRLPASARELLAQDVRLLRMFSDAPRSSLRALVSQVKDLHFWDFLPVHRMRTL